MVSNVAILLTVLLLLLLLFVVVVVFWSITEVGFRSLAYNSGQSVSRLHAFKQLAERLVIVLHKISWTSLVFMYCPAQAYISPAWNLMYEHLRCSSRICHSLLMTAGSNTCKYTNNCRLPCSKTTPATTTCCPPSSLCHPQQQHQHQAQHHKQGGTRHNSYHPAPCQHQ